MEPADVDQIDALIEGLEGVSWSKTPGVSAATAAGFAARLREARELREAAET